MDIPQDGLPSSQRRVALVVLALGTFMAVVDSTVANVALPSFTRAFTITPSQSIWIVNAFQVTVAASLLFFSALGQRITYRSVYQGGLVVFTLGSLACAISQTFESLVTARVLQGIGAAGILSVGPAMYRLIFPHRLLGQGLGIYSLIGATSSALGPTLGGLILSVASWQWIFAINIPFGVLGSVLAKRWLPPSTTSSATLDVPSVLSSSLGLTLLVLGLDALSRHIVLAGDGAMVIGVGLLLWFAIRQTRIGSPLLELRIFSTIRFRLAAITSYFSFMAQGLALTALPFLFHESFLAGPLLIGLLLSIWPLMIALAGPIAGRLSDRFPAPLISSIGLVIFSFGLGLQGSFSANQITAFTLFAVIWHTMLCGIGFGFFQPPNNRELMGSVSRELSGNASGVLATVRVLGQTTGTAVTAACLAEAHTPGGSHLALLIAAGIAGAAVLISLMRLRFATF